MNRTKTKSNYRPLVIIALLIAVSIILVVWTKPKKNTVKTIIAEKGDITHSVRLTGTIIPEREVEIKSRLSGIVERIFVEVGQKLNKGDAIAQIRLIADPQSVEQATRNAETSRIQFNIEKQIFTRNEYLYSSGVISKADFEEAQRIFMVKQAEYESSIRQLEIVEKGFKTGNNDISDMVLATLDGTILELPVKEGSSVTERNNFNDGTTIALMADLEYYNFKTKLSENEVVKINKGDDFMLTVNALDSITLRAHWSLIHPKGESAEGVVKFPVEARIITNGKSSLLKPGFTASATIPLGCDTGVVVIDERLIHFNNDSIYVMVLENGKPHKRVIKPGLSNGIKVSIREGLEVGEQVVE